jgi:hypothetical protein
MSDKIRPLYDEHGAEGYYQAFADTYSNPHEAQIRALVSAHFNVLKTTQGVLDFGAGGGEVTRALKDMGAQTCIGCDPFTWALYERQTGCACLRHSFADIIRGADLGGPYGCVVASFSMHLCPEKDLFSLTDALFGVAQQIAIITPHKRPELERIPNINLTFEASTQNERGKQVRLKVYERNYV